MYFDLAKFISSSIHFLGAWEFYTCKIMSAVSKVLLLPFGLDAFHFFTLLLLAWISSMVLIRSSINGHLCLAPDHKGESINLSSLNMMLAVGFSWLPWSAAGSSLLFLVFWVGSWILALAFSLSVEVIMYLSFICVLLHWCCMLNPPCFCGDISYMFLA